MLTLAFSTFRSPTLAGVHVSRCNRKGDSAAISSCQHWRISPVVFGQAECVPLAVLLLRPELLLPPLETRKQNTQSGGEEECQRRQCETDSDCTGVLERGEWKL